MASEMGTFQSLFWIVTADQPWQTRVRQRADEVYLLRAPLRRSLNSTLRARRVRRLNQSPIARVLGSSNWRSIHREVQTQLHAVDSRATVHAFITARTGTRTDARAENPPPACSFLDTMCCVDPMPMEPVGNRPLSHRAYSGRLVGARPVAENGMDIMVGTEVPMGAGWAFERLCRFPLLWG